MTCKARVDSLHQSRDNLLYWSILKPYWRRPFPHIVCAALCVHSLIIRCFPSVMITDTFLWATTSSRWFPPLVDFNLGRCLTVLSCNRCNRSLPPGWEIRKPSLANLRDHVGFKWNPLTCCRRGSSVHNRDVLGLDCRDAFPFLLLFKHAHIILCTSLTSSASSSRKDWAAASI